MPSKSSPGGRPAGADATLQGERGPDLGSADDYLFVQDSISLDEFLRNSPEIKLDNEEGAEQYNLGSYIDLSLFGEDEGNYTSDSYINPRLFGEDVGNYTPDSHIDPRLLALGEVDSAPEPEIPSDPNLQENSNVPEQHDLGPGGPYQTLHDLTECLEAANQRRELENARPEYPTTGRDSGSVISISSTPPHISSPGTSSAPQLSPTPAADTSPKRIARSASKEDLAPAPADANPEWDQLPMSGAQPITQTFRPQARRAPVGDLVDVGCVLVVQKIKDSGVEAPILYTIYEPLRDWGQFGQFRYTSRGNLHQDVTFDEESLHDFIYNHPMKQNLILRIERHPYGFQCRYRSSPYIKCRAKKCSVDKANNFKVGDFRIAVDEVTGRLGANQFNDNDPYFSACFFHLQCFEELTYTPDLVIRNIIVVDDRGFHSKEPECTRINKMGVAPATVVAFNKWRETAIEKLSEDPQWQPPEKETLAVVIWLSGIRRGRKRTRAPPCITTEDIERKCSTHPGWGGKRVSGLSVADMNLMELQGRSGEMVASRNGKTGKRGVKEPEWVKKKRLLSRKEEENFENSFALAGSTIHDSIIVVESPTHDNITVADPTIHDNTVVEGSSPPTNHPLETESPTPDEDAEYPPAKRRRLASAAPENSLAVQGHNATSAPTLSIPEDYDGDIGDFPDTPYGRNYPPNHNPPPNNRYPPETYYGSQAQHYGPQGQYHDPQAQYHDDPQAQYHDDPQAQYHDDPQAQYHGPQVQYHGPQAQYHAPQAQYHAPQAQYHAPQTQYHAPQAQYHGPQAHYYGPQVQYYGSSAANHGSQATSQVPQANYYSHYVSQGTNYNTLVTNPSLPASPQAPGEAPGIYVAEGENAEEEIDTIGNLWE